MSVFIWILLGMVYLTMLFLLGLSTLRKGHYVLFGLGIFLPFLWIIGAVMGPTRQAVAGEAGAGLR
jgi:hypothetical protein